jgi:glycosyltransferase involved in cell wall biosynthesis
MKLSAVIPVYNEAEAIPLLLERMKPVLHSTAMEYEVLFINDGSRDNTLALLLAIARADRLVKVVSFPRNFGQQAAITAGLDFASGDAVIIMDSDLQDPPLLIPDMVDLFKEGYDVVSPQRRSRAGDGFFKRATAAMFYLIMGKLTQGHFSNEVGEFRLLSSAAVKAVQRFREHHRFLRALIPWLGLREAILPFDRQPRAAGKSKYSVWRMLLLSWMAMTSFSALPLRVATGAGVVAGGVGLIYVILTGHAGPATWNEAARWTLFQCGFFGLAFLIVFVYRVRSPFLVIPCGIGDT